MNPPNTPRFDLWFYSGNKPTVAIEIKGISLFLSFVNSLTFCVPVDRKTHEWYLVMDDGETELMCNYSQLYKYRVSYTCRSKDAEINISVSEEEAESIANSVKEMVNNSPEKFVNEKGLVNYRPSLLAAPVEIIAKRWFKPQSSNRGYPPQVWN